MFVCRGDAAFDERRRERRGGRFRGVELQTHGVHFSGCGCFRRVYGNVYLQSISVDKLMQQLVTVQQDPPDNNGGDGGAVAAEAMRR